MTTSAQTIVASPPLSPLPAALWCGTPEPRLIRVPAWRAVVLDGSAVADDAFSRAVELLLALGSELSMRRWEHGLTPFQVGQLQVVWRAARWRLRLAIPEDVRGDDVIDAAVAVTAARARRGTPAAELSRVRVEVVPACRLMRVVCRGAAAPAYEAVLTTLHERGLRPGDHWAEIFLTDPLCPTLTHAETVVVVPIHDS